MRQQYLGYESIETPIMDSQTLQTDEDMIEDEGNINGKVSKGFVVSSGFGGT